MVTIPLALFSIAHGVASWQLIHGSRLLICLAMAMLAAPATSVARAIIALVAITQLTLPEALALGWFSVVGENLWHIRKQRAIGGFVFGLSSVILTMECSYRLFHLPWPPPVDSTLRLALTAGCFLAANALASAVGDSLLSREPLTIAWEKTFFWPVVYFISGILLLDLINPAIHFFGWRVDLLAIPGLYLLYLGWLSSLARFGPAKLHAEQMAALHLRTIEALALAIEAKDHTTADHLSRVQVYAVEIGKELKLSAIELDALRAAALLHDIGKLAVPEHIISKPGKLTPEEFEKMKIHPIVGAEILERVEFPYPVAPIVAAHHEQWNGSGYPNGLKGEEIPIGARILSAVDCLDALATDRQYRRAIPPAEAMAVLESESGKAFDPRVIEILKRRYVELEVMAKGQKHIGKLSTEVIVERGLAPAAGFASVRENGAGPQKPIDFLMSIAAARQEAQILFDVTRALGTSLSLSETLSVLAVRMEEIIPYDGLAVYISKKGKLKAAYATGDDRRLFSSLEIPLGDGLSGWVAENKMAIINGNPSVEPGYLNDPTRISTMRSALAVPLEGVNGVIGVIALYHSQKDAFRRDHLRILQAIGSKLAFSIENNLDYERIKDSTTIDYLTGLPNARSLFVHLEGEVNRCLNTKTSLTVLTCDLDGFKSVNDRFGQLEGNRILRAVGGAIQAICQHGDYVARMGGDEFVILLPGLPSQAVDSFIARLCNVVREVGRSLGGANMLALSVGRSVLPEDGCQAEKLLAEADMRMYKVKRAKKLAWATIGSTLALSSAMQESELLDRMKVEENGCELNSRPLIVLADIEKSRRR